jgi:hypothetical protein
MAWVKLSDDFPTDPKFVGLSLAATGLWSIAIAYANHHLTDGFVPDALVSSLQHRAPADTRIEDLVDELVRQPAHLDRRPLWTRIEGGFMIHDYHAYQPTAAQVRARREQTSQLRSEAGATKPQQKRIKIAAEPQQKRIKTSTPKPVPVPVNFDDSTASLSEKKLVSLKTSPFIVQVTADFSLELGDADHQTANCTQALRLWRDSGLDEQDFVALMYEAKTRLRAGQSRAGSRSINSKMAYFFTVLRKAVSTREQEDHST